MQNNINTTGIIASYICIYDPRLEFITNTNKWYVIEELSDNLVIKYEYNYKPSFHNNICKLYFPNLKTVSYKKLLKLLFKNLFFNEIIDLILEHLPDIYITSVDKRFCRNLNKEWLYPGNRYFIDPNEYKSDKIFLKKWFGGDDKGYYVGYKYERL